MTARDFIKKKLICAATGSLRHPAKRTQKKNGGFSSSASTEQFHLSKNILEAIDLISDEVFPVMDKDATAIKAFNEKQQANKDCKDSLLGPKDDRLYTYEVLRGFYKQNDLNSQIISFFHDNLAPSTDILPQEYEEWLLHSLFTEFESLLSFKEDLEWRK